MGLLGLQEEIKLCNESLIYFPISNIVGVGHGENKLVIYVILIKLLCVVFRVLS